VLDVGVTDISEVLSAAGLGPRVGEGLVMSGKANLWRGVESVGGALHLTSDRLIFRPHEMNVQVDVLVCERTEISSIKAVRTMGLIPSGIRLTLKSGAGIRLVVSRRREWMPALGADPSTNSSTNST
jgi:hypothetical protein